MIPEITEEVENGEQKNIFTSDLEIIMTAITYMKICNGSLPGDDALTAYHTFHDTQKLILQKYVKNGAIRKILENFDQALKERYLSFS